MSAFNDYCTVCGQLIERGNCDAQLDNDRLYCSSQCQENDRMTIENLKLTNELVGTPASLIRSPLLQPLDRSTGSSTSSTIYDLLDRDQDDMDFDLELSLDRNTLGHGASLPMMTIPRSVVGKDQEFVSYTDHTAEDNYKLWLNYNLAG